MSTFKKICKLVNDHSFPFFMALASALSIGTGFIFQNFYISDSKFVIVATVLILFIATEVTSFCQRYSVTMEIMKENPDMELKEAWARSEPYDDDF